MHRRRRAHALTLGPALLCTVLLAGCEEVPLRESGTLQSYEGMKRDDGLATKAGVRIDAAALRAARTVRLDPTAIASGASQVSLTEAQRRLVTNAVDRALCTSLGERFTVVRGGGPADLTVRATVTRLLPTDEVAAGVSKGVMVVPALVGIPLPVPRVPYGLGGLSAEGEALDGRRRQVAALVWSKGAGVLASSATVSRIGDAYDLGGDFGTDLGRMLATGRSPFGHLPPMPSVTEVNTALGGTPDQSACEAYGRAPGLGGMLGSAVGLPPEWTDDGKPATGDR